MIVTFYHATTHDWADAIMKEGFRDHATVNKRLASEIHYPPGVWMSELPVIDDDLFDGVGLFNFEAERQSFVAVTADEPVLNALPLFMSCISDDPTWPGVQFFAIAKVWNLLPRRRLSLDEALAIRIAKLSAEERAVRRKWIASRRELGYGLEFADRFAAALDLYVSHGKELHAVTLVLTGGPA